jgi:hypothetical protein
MCGYRQNLTGLLVWTPAIGRGLDYPNPMRLPAYLLTLLVACGGGGSNTPDPATGGDDQLVQPEGEVDKAAICEQAMTKVEADNDSGWEQILAKGAPKTLDDMGAAACQLYCGRATVCAVEEACTTMSDAEIVDLKLEETSAENSRRCLSSCNSSARTRQQIQALGKCSQADSDCTTFKSCTAEIQGQ